MPYAPNESDTGLEESDFLLTSSQARASVHLSEEQLAAAKKIIRTKNHVLVTGDAGTGKSTLIRALQTMIGCTTCGTTALAALNVNGTTIDRLFHFDRNDWSIRDSSKLMKIMARTAPNIIVDEASMCGYKMAEIVVDIADKYCKRLILVGDLAQASPVKDDWGTKSRLFKDAEFIKLTKVHRQTDAEYLSALTKIRTGQIDEEVRETFARCRVPNSSDPAFDNYVRMFATNRATATYNMKRFDALQNGMAETRMMAKYTDMRDDVLQAKWPVNQSAIARALEQTRLAHDEWFKPGVRVLVTMNDLSGELDYVNGDAGVITDITTTKGISFKTLPPNQVMSADVESITVALDRRPGVEIEFGRAVHTYKDAFGQSIYSISGFPLQLGYAQTIHRSQGMTLKNACVDVESILAMPGDSRHGLAYVALSRTTDLSGLIVDKWSDEAIYCSPAVYGFI